MTTKEVTCEVDFNINDTPTSVRAFLKKIRPILELRNNWHLDLSRCKYLGPDAASLILALVLEARHLDLAHRVSLPEGPLELRAFCLFSGLVHWLEEGPEPDQTHPENVTVPLRQQASAAFNLTDPVVSLVSRHTDITEDSKQYLLVSVREVFQNVEDHAQSPIGGICCARYMKQSEQVRIAIVDRGLGIATTLRRAHPNIRSGAEALEKVIHGNYTAGSQPHNAGHGISWLWKLTCSSGGKCFILSEDALATQAGADPLKVDQCSPIFNGTGVFFTLPVHFEEEE